MMPAKELWSVPGGSAGVGNGGRQMVGGSNSYPFMASSMQMQGGGAGNGVMPGVAPPYDRSQEVCKYYVNGGCLRGTACPYLHELPDERHLDVNGLGFILNPNVHNAQKTVSSPQAAAGGAAAAVGPLSPTTTGSPLAMSIGNQAGGRPYHMSPSSPGVNNKAVAKPNYNALAAHSGAMPLAPAKAPPRYRPPEPYLEFNLPPALALPLKTSPKEVAQSLSMALLKN